MRNLAHEGEAAFQQDPRRSVVLGKSVGAKGANPPARGGERDQLPGRFRGMAAILVTRSDAVGNLHDFVCAGWAGKTTQADDGVVRAVDNRKAVLPGISRGRSVQSLEEFRGYLRSRQKIPHALSDPHAKAPLVGVSSLKKRAKMVRCLGKKADVRHDFRQASGGAVIQRAGKRRKSLDYCPCFLA